MEYPLQLAGASCSQGHFVLKSRLTFLCLFFPLVQLNARHEH